MKTLLTRGPIEPLWGYFYELYTDDRNPEMVFEDIEVEGKISIETEDDVEEGVVFPVVSDVPVYYGYCCSEGAVGNARCRFDYLTGVETGSIAWGSGELVCTKELAINLLTSELIGIRIEKANLLRTNDLDEEWFHVTSDRHSAEVRERSEPAGYRCWKCGTDPFCKKCGRFTPICVTCEETLFCYENTWKGPSDGRIVYDEISGKFPHPVIDPQLWDGADFFGRIISHRMYQKLLFHKAHPFRLIPVAVNAAGIRELDLQRLEVARTPLDSN